MTNLMTNGWRHPAHGVSFEALMDGLAQEKSAGNVSVQMDGPLALFRYTDQCAYDRAWTMYSKIARGLIVDTAEQRIVATPFPKFFNYGEGEGKGQAMPSLPDEPFDVTEKMDGSLGIVFFHDGRWRVATRGSFKSAQAEWAQAYLRANVVQSFLTKGHTYLVEIIYRENRIVIPYANERLVLLSAYDSEGFEYDRRELETISRFTNLELVQSVTGSRIEDLLAVAKTLESNREGFVVRFASGRRIKIKGDEYCRVHKLISGVTPLAVWELMMVSGDKAIAAYANELPEEFKTDIETIARIMSERFEAFVHGVVSAAFAVRGMSDKDLGLVIHGKAEASSAEIASIPKEQLMWVFAERKSQLSVNARKTGHPLRRKVFEQFRPTANYLAGYAPSTAINRFNQEQSA